jgi:hypothetical protein
MKNRALFLEAEIDHFAKAQEAELVVVKLTKMEYKEMVELLFMQGINLMNKLTKHLHEYTTSNEFVFVELVRLYFTKAETIKWAMKPANKESNCKIPVGIALFLNETLQEMEVNIYSQSLLNKVNKAIVDFGFSPDYSEM